METTQNSESSFLSLADKYAWILSQQHIRGSEQYVRKLSELKGDVTINEQMLPVVREAITTVMDTGQGHWFHQYLASQAESHSVDMVDIAGFLTKTCSAQGLNQELQCVEVMDKPVMITSPKKIESIIQICLILEEDVWLK